MLPFCRCVEYKNDSQIIPRSTSVIVKRMPASKPGKGKAAIYLSGGSAKTTTSLDSTAAKGGASGNSWARPGHSAMSRRFDGKEEKPKPSPVRAPFWNAGILSNPSAWKVPEVIQSSQTTDDEGARIRAMFQASTEQWNETQEKMAQSVLQFHPSCLLSIRYIILNNSFPFLCFIRVC
jgi:protein MPE1